MLFTEFLFLDKRGETNHGLTLLIKGLKQFKKTPNKHNDVCVLGLKKLSNP